MIYVGVHVRRRNYEKYLQARGVGGFLLSRAYFKTAMDYFRAKFKNVIFIVASDDQEWCKKNLQENDVKFTRTFTNTPETIAESSYVDLTILAKCNHSIISFGSFGFWSAYLRPEGTTLFLNNEYQRDEINFYHINKYSKNTKWIPWNDPCVTKINNKWQFFDEDKDCIK